MVAPGYLAWTSSKDMFSTTTRSAPVEGIAELGAELSSALTSSSPVEELRTGIIGAWALSEPGVEGLVWGSTLPVEYTPLRGAGAREDTTAFATDELGTSSERNADMSITTRLSSPVTTGCAEVFLGGGKGSVDFLGGVSGLLVNAVTEKRKKRNGYK